MARDRVTKRFVNIANLKKISQNNEQEKKSPNYLHQSSI
jgi:hypothetical protein